MKIKILIFNLILFVFIGNLFSQTTGQLCIGSYKSSKSITYQKKISNKDSIYNTTYLVYMDNKLTYRVLISHVKKEKTILIKTEDISGDVMSAECTNSDKIVYTDNKRNVMINGVYSKSHVRSDIPSKSVVFFMNDKYENLNVKEIKLCFGTKEGKDLFLIFNENPTVSPQIEKSKTIKK